MKDPLMEILTTDFHYRNSERLVELMDKITSQDTLKLLCLVPHNDLYNGILEEAVKRITDTDFLDKLAHRGKLRMSMSCSSTYRYCEERIVYLKFIENNNLKFVLKSDDVPANVWQFGHHLSRIKDSRVEFFKNDEGWYWVLHLLKPIHQGLSGYFRYDSKYKKFIYTFRDRSAYSTEMALDSDPEKSFNLYFETFNSKYLKDSMNNRRDEYVLKLIENSSEHYIVSA